MTYNQSTNSHRLNQAQIECFELGQYEPSSTNIAEYTTIPHNTLTKLWLTVSLVC